MDTKLTQYLSDTMTWTRPHFCVLVYFEVHSVVSNTCPTRRGIGMTLLFGVSVLSRVAT